MPKGQRQFSCGHFGYAWDEHDKCPRCREENCSSLLTCPVCEGWSAEYWLLFRDSRERSEERLRLKAVKIAHKMSANVLSHSSGVVSGTSVSVAGDTPAVSDSSAGSKAKPRAKPPGVNTPLDPVPPKCRRTGESKQAKAVNMTPDSGRPANAASQQDRSGGSVTDIPLPSRTERPGGEMNRNESSARTVNKPERPAKKRARSVTAKPGTNAKRQHRIQSPKRGRSPKRSTTKGRTPRNHSGSRSSDFSRAESDDRTHQTSGSPAPPRARGSSVAVRAEARMGAPQNQEQAHHEACLRNGGRHRVDESSSSSSDSDSDSVSIHNTHKRRSTQSTAARRHRETNRASTKGRYRHYSRSRSSDSERSGMSHSPHRHTQVRSRSPHKRSLGVRRHRSFSRSVSRERRQRSFTRRTPPSARSTYRPKVHSASDASDMNSVLAALQRQNQSWQEQQQLFLSQTVHQIRSEMRTEISARTPAATLTSATITQSNPLFPAPMVQPTSAPQVIQATPSGATGAGTVVQTTDAVSNDEFEPDYDGETEHVLDLHPNYSDFGSPSHNSTADIDLHGEDGNQVDNDELISTSAPTSAQERDSFNRVFTRLCPTSAAASKQKYLQVSDLMVEPNTRVETAEWAIPPSLQAALSNLAGSLQNKKGEPVTTPLCDLSVNPTGTDFFKPSAKEVLGKESFRLKVDASSEFQPTPPAFSTYFSHCSLPSTFKVDLKWLQANEELARRTAIAVGQTESATRALLGLVTENFPAMADHPDWTPIRQVLAASIVTSQKLSAASVANFSLIKRDHLLHELAVPKADGRRARAAQFTGSELIGPDSAKFVAFITAKQAEEATAGGRYSYFKTNNSFVPKVTQTQTQFRSRRGGRPFPRRSSSFRSRPGGNRPTSSGMGRGGRGRGRGRGSNSGTGRGRGSGSNATAQPSGRGRGARSSNT